MSLSALEARQGPGEQQEEVERQQAGARLFRSARAIIKLTGGCKCLPLESRRLCQRRWRITFGRLARPAGASGVAVK